MSFSFSHNFLIRVLALSLSVLSTLSVAPTLAQDADESPGPGEVVREATERIMAVVEEAPEYFDEEPDRYFRLVGDELDRVVDFRGFARGVMGSYASSSRYRSLDEAGKEQLKNQLDEFTKVLRESLIQTYSKGLLAFGGSRVELAGTEVSPGSTRVASVTQLVFGDGGAVYTVKYQMGQYRDGTWQLRNLIIENINLGEIYRNQFESAVAGKNGDVDAVIASWDETGVKRVKAGG